MLRLKKESIKNMFKNTTVISNGLCVGALISMFFNTLGFNWLTLVICSVTLVVYWLMTMFLNYQENLEETKRYELDILRNNNHDDF